MSDIKNKQLQQAITQLGKDVLQAADAINMASTEIHRDSLDTARVAEQIATMGVDPASVSETRELAKTMVGVADAATDYVSAADTSARRATAAVDQAKASHDGIHEAVNRSTVDVSGLNRQWITPE